MGGRMKISDLDGFNKDAEIIIHITDYGHVPIQSVGQSKDETYILIEIDSDDCASCIECEDIK
jgi:hypothetical protein